MSNLMLGSPPAADLASAFAAFDTLTIEHLVGARTFLNRVVAYFPYLIALGRKEMKQELVNAMHDQYALQTGLSLGDDQAQLLEHVADEFVSSRFGAV